MAEGRKLTKERRALKIKYGIWLGLSKEARKSAGMPVDQKEFAEKYDISEISLANWKKEDIVRETRENALGLFLKDATFQIYQALIQSATDTKSGKGAQDRRTFFQLTGELGKQSDKDTGTEHTEVKIIIEQPSIRSNFEQPRNSDKTELRGAEEVSGEPDS